MLLFTNSTSERKSTSQGGNKYLFINLSDEYDEILNIKATPLKGGTQVKILIKGRKGFLSFFIPKNAPFSN